MKRILVLALCVAISTDICNARKICPEDSLAFVQAHWQTVKLEKGAEAACTTIQMFESTQSISVIRYPARRFRSGFVDHPYEYAGKTSELARRAGAKMAINAGYFDPGPVSCVYLRIGEDTLSYTKPKESRMRVNAVVGFKDRKGKKLRISRCSSEQYDEITSRWHSVMACGPLLMEGDEIVVPESYAKAYPDKGYGGFYDARHPRSAIGSDDKGYIYLVVIDGRFPGQGEGTTIYQTAVICDLLGMTDAINLDGGGSSALWSEETGVLNHPSDNRKFDHNGERKIPNIIGVF